MIDCVLTTACSGRRPAPLMPSVRRTETVMLVRSQDTEIQFREWQPDRPGDNNFTHVVPSVKWHFFARKLRPLADDCAAQVCRGLFAGVAHPFHYQRARGWMRKVFGTVRSAPDWMERGLSLEAALAEAFGPGDPGTAYVVCGWVGRPVYAATWPDMLDLVRRGWLTASHGTFVLCAERTRAVALHWEGTGVYFGKRGERSLT